GTAIVENLHEQVVNPPIYDERIVSVLKLETVTRNFTAVQHHFADPGRFGQLNRNALFAVVEFVQHFTEPEFATRERVSRSLATWFQSHGRRSWNSSSSDCCGAAR